MAVQVLVVEDVAELRTVIKKSVELGGDFQVVGTAGDAAAAIELAEKNQPDIVVLDLGLPDLAGRQVLTRLHHVSPDARVVVYSASYLPGDTSVRARVEAFVDKESALSELVEQLARVSAQRHEVATILLEHRRDPISKARRFIENNCREWGCEGNVDAATVIVSELVTNAFRHADSDCELRATFSGEVLRIDVTDHGSGTPDLKRGDAEDEGGRGLHIVGALANAWGTDPLPGPSKVVWAVVSAELPVASAG